MQKQREVITTASYRFCSCFFCRGTVTHETGGIVCAAAAIAPHLEDGQEVSREVLLNANKQQRIDAKFSRQSAGEKRASTTHPSSEC